MQDLPDRIDIPEDDDLSRREISRRAAKFLAYTAPALIAVVTAKADPSY